MSFNGYKPHHQLMPVLEAEAQAEAEAEVPVEGRVQVQAKVPAAGLAQAHHSVVLMDMGGLAPWQLPGPLQQLPPAIQVVQAWDWALGFRGYDQPCT